MDFMEDIWTKCHQCNGKRFDPEILSVTYKGNSIYDILEMEVESAITLFEAIPSIYKKLKLLEKVGLNYLHLGQSSNTLSGGEAQRIKLAKELSKKQTGKTLYILDEPTTGLHFHDMQKLLDVLQELADKKNSVIVIEHNMDFVKTCDYIIDIGPDAGDKGGKVIGEGTPNSLKNKKPPTALALKNTFKPIISSPTEKTIKKPTHLIIENGLCAKSSSPSFSLFNSNIGKSSTQQNAKSSGFNVKYLSLIANLTFHNELTTILY
jgi:excinuclease ABC subunit A